MSLLLETGATFRANRYAVSLGRVAKTPEAFR